MCAPCLLMALLAVGADPVEAVNVGAKSFTESVIMGEMTTLLAREIGRPAKTKELGGTRILWSALRTGEIDVYTEYTGTIREEIFTGELLPDEAALQRRLAEEGIVMSRPLGFNNTYALGVTQEVAEKYNLRTISDLKQHPNLRLGFSSEFMDRGDGWPSLSNRYRLPQTDVRGMEHALAYRALESGDIDVMDLYSTDPNIKLYGLRVLKDDLGHFPSYHAVFLYRQDLNQRMPDFIDQLRRLEGRIDDEMMLELNQRVELQHQTELRVAADFLAHQLGVYVEIEEQAIAQRIWQRTREHLFLVAMSLGAAILVSVPLGIIAAKKPLLGQFIVGTAEVVQTIPGLALLILMSVAYRQVGLPTIGELPVIVALFLYSLLPIIRNTMAGLTDVPQSLKESATALGLAAWSRLWLIELPMASRLILAGIKTTAVINVGYAALGGLIGAGGYGQPIITGLRKNSEALMLEGAIPAAILALLVKAAFEYSERFLVPRGLRVK